MSAAAARRGEQGGAAALHLYASTSLVLVIRLARHAVVGHQLIPRAGDRGLFNPDYLWPRLSRYLLFSYGRMGQNSAAILGRKKGH